MNLNMLSTHSIHNAAQLTELIHDVGFLPLLNSGIGGFSAEELVDDECRYVVFPDGGWDWPLWKWKGEIVRDGGCVYGKFFDSKAGFISTEWWPHFCNYRRGMAPAIEPASIEETILMTLREHGSLITRDLRAACGFTGKGMRGKFDAYITRMQMSCRIVTEDFVYPRDRHGHEYGWGLSLLTTPERLYGIDTCHTDESPQESMNTIMTHLRHVLPQASDNQLLRMMR